MTNLLKIIKDFENLTDEEKEKIEAVAYDFDLSELLKINNDSFKDVLDNFEFIAEKDFDEYAEKMANKLYDLNNSKINSYNDFEQFAEDLMMDFCEENGFFFRRV